MNTFERIFVIRPLHHGWAVNDGTDDIATVASQSGAIRCAAVAAMTAQAKGYTATFRLDV